MQPLDRNQIVSRVLAVPLLGAAVQMLRTKFGAPRLTDFDSPSLQHLPDGDFARLIIDHDGRQVNKWVQYFGIYDELLSKYRGGFTELDGTVRPLRFLEIGVSYGGSLELWREYLGEEAVIVGVDVDPRCASIAGDDLQIRIGSQADTSFLQGVVTEMGGVDVVLDDGSHIARHQRASFDAVFPLLSEGGLYVVEDAHTSYWLGHGGGYRRPGTFIEVAKGLVDGMHGWYFRFPLRRRSRQAMASVTSVQFFDSVVAIRKQSRSRPQVVQVGSPSF